MLTNHEIMRTEDLTRLLRTDDHSKGYSLTWLNPRFLDEDPTVLYLKEREVYRWSYDPTMVEVWEKIKELEACG